VAKNIGNLQSAPYKLDAMKALAILIIIGIVFGLLASGNAWLMWSGIGVLLVLHAYISSQRITRR